MMHLFVSGSCQSIVITKSEINYDEILKVTLKVRYKLYFSQEVTMDTYVFAILMYHYFQIFRSQLFLLKEKIVKHVCISELLFCFVFCFLFCFVLFLVRFCFCFVLFCFFFLLFLLLFCFKVFFLPCATKDTHGAKSYKNE